MSSGSTGFDTLISIEQVRFNDATVDLSPLGGFARLSGNGTSSNEKNPRAATLNDGGYVVVFEAENGTPAANGSDGASGGVAMQRYDASGRRLGGPTTVNTFTADLQFDPDVAATANGGYAVVWASNGQDGDSFGVYLQRYAADGNRVGVETRVASVTAGSQRSPSITGLAYGEIVVAWETLASSTGVQLFAQVIAADGGGSVRRRR